MLSSIRQEAKELFSNPIAEIMKKIMFWAFALIICNHTVLQAQQRDKLEAQLAMLQAREEKLLAEIERLDLADLRDTLLPYLPTLADGEYLIKHSLMVLVYSEPNEQAKWVGHVLSPRVIEGEVNRTNDFRIDPQVRTGSAVEADYFLKYLQPDSTYQYDGYGYDRGHLAPSADFRWSEIALSESYYYSNMSPQLPDFNRGVWATLENELRGYLYRNPTHNLIVFTGPVLEPDLPVQERSPNELTIPRKYWKVVYDPTAGRMAGFLLPNEGSEYPVSRFAVPVDEVEQAAGIDFYPNLSDDREALLEASIDKAAWLESVALGEAEPLEATALPRNHFNTIQARRYMDQSTDVHVCGKVVGARTSRAGNVLLNLDKKYPNQIFTVFVRKENLINFPYDPEEAFQGKVICARGRVVNLSGKPAMFIEDANDLTSLRK